MGIEKASQDLLFDLPPTVSKKDQKTARTATGGRIRTPTRSTQHHDLNAKETPVVSTPESLKRKPIVVYGMNSD